MDDESVLLRQQLHLFLSYFDVFDCVDDLFTHLLSALVLIIDANIAKCLSEIFVAIMLRSLLELFFILIDIAYQQRLEINVACYLLKVNLSSFRIN
jgi:hypothetical protein